MAEVKSPVRVLQSGKVYRQMFDAEVQLMKSLDAVKRTSQSSLQKVTLPELQSRSATKLVSSKQMLTNRQKTWTEGMPNDAVTENPVCYRQVSAAATARMKMKSLDPEVQEVHCLPNVVQVKKKNSNINEKIAERRKERHDKVLDDMHNDLCLVSSRTETRITTIGENLQSQLKEDDIIIESFFKTILSNEELVNFSYNELENLWNKIEGRSPKRREFIENAHAWFNEVEDERLGAISSIFKNYSIKLEKIAYLLKADVHRLIEKEAMMINQSVLANRRSYAKLYSNLLEGDIEREVEQHRTWLERVKDWKKLNAELAVQQFTEFMKSDPIVEPPEVTLLMDKYLSEQKLLSERRWNILNQLKELKPPTSTKTSVYKWNTVLGKAHEDLDNLHSRMIRDLHHKYESTCQQCLSEIEKYKQNLLKSKVCDEDDMSRIVNDHLLPQVGDRLKIFEKKLEEMDKHLEDQATSAEKHMKILFKFAQGASHLWDVHQTGMAKQQRKLHDELEQARESHDAENQEKEMKLDVTLDRLRQESTEEALNTYMDQCMVMLSRIRNGYESFHVEQLERVSHYPEMIEAEVSRYEEIVCKYFNVKKQVKKEEPSVKQEELTQPISMPALSTVDRAELDQVKTYEGVQAQMESESKKTLEDVLVTNDGTAFFILTSSEMEDCEPAEGTKKKKEESHDGAADTTSRDSLPDYVKNIQVGSSLVKELKQSVRISFLNHLEEWKQRTMDSAHSQVRDKSEELASELDLRLHLHAPRSRRIEIDVKNVRAAELVLHKERVTRHCRGINAALESLKNDFNQMTKAHDEEAYHFRSLAEKTETEYTKATKSSKLKSLNEALHNDLNAYVENVKTSLRDFRRILDTTLGKLRESNAQCARSFKLFCEGGNFSPDETVPLRKKLEKTSQRVDNAEGIVMKDLEGMESRRIEMATDFVNKLDEKFRHHSTDLVFLEAMQRWATNAQVFIKSEASFSNGMAAEVGSHLATLRRRVDACERPNIDKETVNADLLHSYALQIMESLQSRAQYLDCYLTEQPIDKVEESEMQEMVAELPKTAERVPGATSKKSVTQLSSRQSMEGTAQSRARPIGDDAAINLIKTILRAPKEKSFSDVDDVKSTVTSRPPPSTANSGTAISARSGKRQASSGSTTTPDPQGSKKSINDGVTVVYKRRDTKFDSKYMVFGSKTPEGDHFKIKIQRILYEAHDGMLSTAEIYFKQKGIRSPTRPQLIQDSFDLCAEQVIDKLQKFENQALDFHNKSLQDFRQLLHDLEYELCNVPRLVFKDFLQKQLQSLDDEQKTLEKDFKKQEQQWESLKMKKLPPEQGKLHENIENNTMGFDEESETSTGSSHKELMRPTLGHPDQSEILQELSDQEQNRQTTHVSGIDTQADVMEKSASACASRFAERLSSVSNQLLKEFDNLLTVDDVIVGRVLPHKELTSVLVRRRAEGYELSEVADPAFGIQPIIERGIGVWPAPDFSKLGLEAAALPSVSTDPFETSHITLPQAKTKLFREGTLAQYATVHLNSMNGIAATKSRRLNNEERWRQNWKESIERVVNLYK